MSRALVPRIMGSPAYRHGGLIIVTFDESGDDRQAGACCGERLSVGYQDPSHPDTNEPGLFGPGGGRVGAVALSPFIRPGTTSSTEYNHYSLLKTVERIFGLKLLGDAFAAAGQGARHRRLHPLAGGSDGAGRHVSAGAVSSRRHDGRMTAAQLAGVAGLLADRSRAAICLALLDDRGWTVGELARHAEIAPSTASEHVARLVGGGLATVTHQGRHRYVRLAGHAQAQLIEDLAEYAAPGPPVQRGQSLRAVRASEAMVRARTCYDHLAGRLGVGITDALTDAGLLEQTRGFALTSAGLDWLESAMGADVEALRTGRRPLVRQCIDWTERRPHLGGAAGAAICARFLGEGWIRRISGGRAVRVTHAGAEALRRLPGIDVRHVA